jgi:hypothetical protein
MNWLEKIRNKPQKEKERWLKIILVVCFFLLILFWILIGNNIFNYERNNSIVKTFFKELTNRKNSTSNPLK